jgi:hypothetical protein
MRAGNGERIPGPFDEEGLDKALAAAGGSGEGQTLPSDEDIILQRRPALGHAKSTRAQTASIEGPASDAVTGLKETKALAAERLQVIREYLAWLPDGAHDSDEPAGGAGETRWPTPLHRPKPMSAEDLMTAGTAVRRSQANDRSALGDLHVRFTELMEEVEYLHGGMSMPGGHGLLLFRHSEALHAGEPTCYDDKCADMMHMYRYAADTATSNVDQRRGRNPFSPPARGGEIMESGRKAGSRHMEIMELPGTPSRSETPHSNHDTKVRGPDETARRGIPKGQGGSLRMPHGKHASAGRAHAWCVRAAGTGTTPHCRILRHRGTTLDGGAACSQARTLRLRQEHARGGSSGYHMCGMQRHLRTRRRGHHVTTHPPNDGDGAAGVGGVVDHEDPRHRLRQGHGLRSMG